MGVLHHHAATHGSAPTSLTFAADQDNKFVEYTLSLIAQTSGVNLVREEAGQTPLDVYYGSDHGRPCGLRIPYVDGYRVDTVPGVPAETPPPDPVAVFPFDLFAAIRFWLADEPHENAPPDHFDQHGRFLPEHSAQAAVGVVQIPIVNAYLLLLRSHLARRFAVPVASHLPSGKRCVVVLSHDVDSPIDPGAPWHTLRLAAENVRKHVKVGISLTYAAGAVWYAARSRVSDPHARHALFKEVMDAEAARGFQSTFFFAAVSRFSVAGCRQDVGYSVSRMPFPQILPELVERGNVVGLHVGYLADANVSAIASEREILERLAGAPVTTSRHHYYHLSCPFWATLEAHGRAGLAIDSSISFNYVPGYRLGVALPFRPWNPQTERAVSTVQIPTALMDSMLLAQPGQTVQGALEGVESVLAQLKRFEGVAALDWHEYTSYPGSRRFRTWGQTYLEILGILAADPEIAVLGYEEAAGLNGSNT